MHMFGRRNITFFLGVALALVLLIVILIVVFAGGGPSNKPKAPIASYANDPTAQATLLIDGPEGAGSSHNQIQITITNSTSTINIIKGYNNNIIRSKTYSNSEAAFHVFLRALEYSEFDVGHNDPKLSQASGYCPLGNRYIFSFNADNTQIQRYWITSCPGDPHTFDGNLDLTVTLFQNQIEDFNSITSGLNIAS